MSDTENETDKDKDVDTEDEMNDESTANQTSSSYINQLREGVKEGNENNNWYDYFQSCFTIFVGVLIYGFVGANLTSILCWSTAEFDKSFPTDLDKLPYTGDPPTEPNFWSDKFSKGLENCDLEEIGEVFWPMQNITFPYTWNRPSEEMMDMGVDWYVTWFLKYFGMSAAYSWSSARYCVRWVLLFFKMFPTLMNNTAIPFYVMPYIFYLFSLTSISIYFGFFMTWAGYAFAPVEMGYLLLLSSWVSAFNAMVCVYWTFNIYSAFAAAAAAGPIGGALVTSSSIFGGSFNMLIVFLSLWSIFLTAIEYIWAGMQGIGQHFIFIIFCFTAGLFKNGGLYKITDLMWSHRKGLIIIFMFYSWVAATGYLNSQTVLGIFMGFIICIILLFTEKAPKGKDGLTAHVNAQGQISS